jgi:energy-coupling factor transporter ATP-binding protein EcfA2/histidinol phosphatase-like PHP family hydrolase
VSGARFVRADLHVHLNPDGVDEPAHTAAEYIEAAVNRGIEVLAITDHNTTRNVRPALKAARGKPILVLPGIEVGSRDGHLIALFGPDGLDEAEDFATSATLDLGPVLGDGSRRSAHTMLHLLNEVSRRGGIGIIAHVDAGAGIQSTVKRSELAELLSHPALAGVEFRELKNLRSWFSDDDPDDSRRAAWSARQRKEDLRERGLALIMSSDAHDSSLVGKDGTDRPLTRLRVGDRTYTAVTNALLHNPKARCKVEADIPASYPHLVSVSFVGGFLGGVSLDLSQNLNCLIGGRGSGKSTALLAVRAALGAAIEDDEDPDDPYRMPDETTVRFVDAAGTERTATRARGGSPVDEGGRPVELTLADLGQGQTGNVASSYRSQPLQMLSYLDEFCDLDREIDAERAVLDRLADNAADVVRTSFRQEEYRAATDERQKLEANIKAAQKGKLEDIASWAIRLATQQAMIGQLRSHVDRLSTARSTAGVPSLDEIARETKTDLAQRPLSDMVDPLSTAVRELNAALKGADTARTSTVKNATSALTKVLSEWDAEYKRWDDRRKQRQSELEAEGLKVQAGALTAMGSRFETLTKRLAELQDKRRQHLAALTERDSLLTELAEARRLIYERRRKTLKLVTRRANESSLGLKVSVTFRREGVRKPWRDWLGPKFRFKADRLMRLGVAMTPQDFARHIAAGELDPIRKLTDTKGDRQAFFTTEDLDQIAALSWDERFALETMRLEDLPRIEVADSEHGLPREFDRLSAGQQRSVLLSLLLCADRSDPLIIDQPEDHLDAPYIATGVVRHLEQAKQRRQVIIATHNANLAVLGDSELVIPLYAEDGKGTVYDAGAVDDPATLRHVCRLLEGGASAFTRRGRRYGFEFLRIPAL